MRKVVMGTMLAAAALAATQAQAAERRFTVSNFDSIEAAGPFDVIVNVGKAVSVRAEGEQKDLDRLRIEVEDRELEIGTVRERSWFDWSKSSPVKIYVTVPALNEVSLSGSGDLSVDRVKADDFEASLAGSGDLSVGSLTAGKAEFAIAGSGDITVGAGTCRSAEASIAGSGDINLAGLRCQTLDVDIAGSGGVKAHATQTAKVSVMGSGDVVVTGGARCSTSKMGSGSVRCG